MDLRGQLERCHEHQVDADGNLNRYLQECMIVHDEWVIYGQFGWYRRSMLSFCPYILNWIRDESFFVLRKTKNRKSVGDESGCRKEGQHEKTKRTNRQRGDAKRGRAHPAVCGGI